MNTTPSFPKTKADLVRMYSYLNPGTCKGCNRPIEWWLTINKRKIPYDPTPGNDSGTVVTHWSTCPKSKNFKGKAETVQANAVSARPIPSERLRTQGVEALLENLGARAVVAIFEDGASCTWLPGLDGEDLRHELITAANHVRQTIQAQGASTR